jgi:hypothetical protein
MTGELERMGLYAGQPVGLVHDTAPAAEIVARMSAAAGGTVPGSASALRIIGVCAVVSVLCGAMVELSRRGRTRLGLSLLVVGFIALGLVEAL